MDWEQLLNKERLGKSGDLREEIGRSHYHKDHDRIVFSSSFRRLGKKTQVHPLTENDHIHTRLTHSVEAGSVGRSLGIAAGYILSDLGKLPEWITPANIGEIVQSACLAHDIGNPPFGHAGEEAIRSWFDKNSGKEMFSDLDQDQRRDLSLFEGNALGFRVITKTETMAEGGLGLSYPTLGAFLKYPWTSNHAESPKYKFSCFQSELKTLELVATKLGLIHVTNGKWKRHPLAFLVEAADDICYSMMDLEDAVEMKIVSIAELRSFLEPILASDKNMLKFLNNEKISNRKKIAHVRGKYVGDMVAAMSGVFSDKIDNIESGTFQQPLSQLLPQPEKQLLSTAKDIAQQHVFDHKRKVRLEIGCYSILGTLLDAFCSAIHDMVKAKRLTFKSSRILTLLSIPHNNPENIDLYEGYMRVVSYIGGMTDSYATYIAQQICGSNVK